jgi:hypothetical protein
MFEPALYHSIQSRQLFAQGIWLTQKLQWFQVTNEPAALQAHQTCDELTHTNEMAMLGLLPVFLVSCKRWTHMFSTAICGMRLQLYPKLFMIASHCS